MHISTQNLSTDKLEYDKQEEVINELIILYSF